MRKHLQVILFLKPFALGLIAPVYVLMLTTHGATLTTAALFKGLAAGVIIAAEFPSGVFADLYGRKRSFVVSQAFQLGAMGLLLLSASGLMLAAALTLYGLSRAFSSGSLEALALDAMQDDRQITRAASRLNILESGGLATGALAGGFLAGLGTRYAVNIAASLGVTAVILLLTLATVREAPRGQAAAPRLREHLRKSFSFVLTSRMIRMLFVLCFLTGFAMFTVETYWQPALKAFQSPAWMFGAVNSAGFACVIAGTKLSEALLTRLPKRGIAVFLLSKAAMSLCLMLLIAAALRVSFLALYLLWYVFLGGNGVAEQALLNRQAPSAQRASILSLFSFALQIGALIASLGSFLITAAAGFHASWLLAGGLLCGATLLYMALTWRRETSSREAIDKPPEIRYPVPGSK